MISFSLRDARRRWSDRRRDEAVRGRDEGEPREPREPRDGGFDAGRFSPTSPPDAPLPRIGPPFPKRNAENSFGTETPNAFARLELECALADRSGSGAKGPRAESGSRNARTARERFREPTRRVKRTRYASSDARRASTNAPSNEWNTYRFLGRKGKGGFFFSEGFPKTAFATRSSFSTPRCNASKFRNRRGTTHSRGASPFARRDRTRTVYTAYAEAPLPAMWTSVTRAEKNTEDASGFPSFPPFPSSKNKPSSSNASFQSSETVAAETDVSRGSTAEQGSEHRRDGTSNSEDG